MTEPAIATEPAPERDVTSPAPAAQRTDQATAIKTSAIGEAAGASDAVAAAELPSTNDLVAAAPVTGWEPPRSSRFSSRRVWLAGGAVALLATVIVIALGIGPSSTHRSSADSDEATTNVESARPSRGGRDQTIDTSAASAVAPDPAPTAVTDHGDAPMPREDSSPSEEAATTPAVPAPVEKPQQTKKPVKKVRPVKRARRVQCSSLDCV